MEILTFPVGIVVGTLTVAVSLGEVRSLETGASTAVFVADPSTPKRLAFLQRFLWNESPSWAGGRTLDSVGALEAALRDVRDTLDRQRLVWVDGELAPGAIVTSGDEGFAVSGRAAMR